MRTWSGCVRTPLSRCGCQWKGVLFFQRMLGVPSGGAVRASNDENVDRSFIIEN
jgi:hypothetical protein